MIDLINHIKESSRGEDKIIVVSEWTSVLELFENYLEEERIEFVTLSGKSSLKSRDNIIIQFNKPIKSGKGAIVGSPI